MLHLHAELHSVWNCLHVLHDAHCLQYANSSSFFVSWCVVFASRVFFFLKRSPWSYSPSHKSLITPSLLKYMHTPRCVRRTGITCLWPTFGSAVVRGVWWSNQSFTTCNMQRSWVIICIIKVKRWITSQGGVSSRQIDRSRAHPFSCC